MTSRSPFGRPFQAHTYVVCAICMYAVPPGDALQRRLIDGVVVCAPACKKTPRIPYRNLFPSEED